MKDGFLSKNVSQIIGITPEGNPIKSDFKQALMQNGTYWANRIIETPIACAI